MSNDALLNLTAGQIFCTVYSTQHSQILYAKLTQENSVLIF